MVKPPAGSGSGRANTVRVIFKNVETDERSSGGSGLGQSRIVGDPEIVAEPDEDGGSGHRHPSSDAGSTRCKQQPSYSAATSAAPDTLGRRAHSGLSKRNRNRVRRTLQKRRSGPTTPHAVTIRETVPRSSTIPSLRSSAREAAIGRKKAR